MCEHVIFSFWFPLVPFSRKRIILRAKILTLMECIKGEGREKRNPHNVYLFWGRMTRGMDEWGKWFLFYFSNDGTRRSQIKRRKVLYDFQLQFSQSQTQLFCWCLKRRLRKVVLGTRLYTEVHNITRETEVK